MPASRMRMRPWLEKQINSNEIPGLQWVDKEEQIFQIPWKHAARHGWEMAKDACLFEKWAIHTGRYKSGEKAPDPKTWKANFRCAMNSLPDVQEVKGRSINKGSSAVRVYKMLPPSVKVERKERRSKSSRDSKKNSMKMDFEDSSPEPRLGTTGSDSPDDHNCYTDHSYSGPEVHNTPLASVDLTQCHTTGLAGLEISLADSTNDLYPFQVSPSSSCTSATEDDEGVALADDLIKINEAPTSWHPADVDGKGYLSNEAGIFFTEPSTKDLVAEFEKMGK
ncbi:interferon regulatory factor 1 isoform X2 [Ambystoma mexicanum]|uniref:interferon regulatory factor 1 isoform X2 n=1 Tax=Ambystoma mexicanum TaxID=8296 RepID=UPI0037E6F882